MFGVTQDLFPILHQHASGPFLGELFFAFKKWNKNKVLPLGLKTYIDSQWIVSDSYSPAVKMPA